MFEFFIKAHLYHFQLAGQGRGVCDRPNNVKFEQLPFYKRSYTGKTGWTGDGRWEDTGGRCWLKLIRLNKGSPRKY